VKSDGVIAAWMNERWPVRPSQAQDIDVSAPMFVFGHFLAQAPMVLTIFGRRSQHAIALSSAR
jgi:hypothetical protein